MKLKSIYASLRSELSLIERKLEQTLRAEQPILMQASHQLLKAGGKRLRPILVLLSGKLGNDNHNLLIETAVALELIHTASLVHDDVIDDADVRRGKPTVKAKWDNQTAMYTGDYIFAKALERITSIPFPEAHKRLSETIREVTLGEIEQIRDQFNWNQNFRSYLRRIKRKTALLISTCCHLGALVSGAHEKHQIHLSRFGYYVGMSYQIKDDILDYVGTKEKLGKPAGGDLKQGNVTLPALIAFCDQKLKNEIIALFNGRFISDNQLKRAIEYIKESGAIERSEKVSQSYLKKAYAELAHLPQSEARHSLEQIAHYIGKRKF